jgi:PAS domain S-box-containing protein
MPFTDDRHNGAPANGALAPTVKHAASAILVLDAMGFVADAGDAGPAFLGYGAGEMAGEHIFRFIEGAATEPVVRAMEAAHSGTEQSLLVVFRRKSGARVPVMMEMAPLPEGVGPRGGFSAKVTDIGHWARLEERVARQEQELRLLLDTYPGPVLLVTRDGTIVTANRWLSEQWGLSLEAIPGRSLYEFLPEDVARSRRACIEGVFVSGAEARFHDMSGGRFYEHSLRPVRAGDGTVAQVAVFAFDVTELRAMEEALRESEARSRAMIEAFDGYVFVCSQDYRIEFMNRALMNRAGYDGTGRPCYTVLHGRRSVCPWCVNDRVFRGETVRWEFQSPLDGRWYYSSNIPLYHADGSVSKQSMFTDITERKTVEEALRKSEEMFRRSEERYRTLFDNAADAIVLADESGALLECNKQAERLIGWPRETIQTMKVGDLHPPDDRQRIAAAFQEIVDEGIGTVSGVSVVTSEGTKIPVQISGSRVVHEGRTMAMGFFSDMTEQLAGQEALENATRRLKFLSQRLLEVQEEQSRHIARELHDEIGQALTAIKINLQTAIRSRGEALSASMLDENVRLVDRVLQQVRNLSLELHPTILDDLGLPAALRWYVDWVCQRAGIAGHFQESTGGARLPPAVETACFRIVQEALTNVVRHAKASSVTVTLTEEGKSLNLVISDRGKGFDLAAARQRALRGESMGLPGMEERAVLAGGYLSVHSVSGEGTSIRAFFPLQRRRKGMKKGRKAQR